MFSLAFVIVSIDVWSYLNIWRLIFEPNFMFLYIVMSSLSSKLGFLVFYSILYIENYKNCESSILCSSGSKLYVYVALKFQHELAFL